MGHAEGLDEVFRAKVGGLSQQGTPVGGVAMEPLPFSTIKSDFARSITAGLIVPVIRNADEKNLLGLSRAIDDLAVRARSKKLNPDEVQAGTFTITNPGVFGAVYGLPLINQPQVAILGVGVIEKRVVVVQADDSVGLAGNDAIAIHPTCHLSLGYDHRLIDGADAGRFLAYIKDRLEQFDESWM